jgi:hypothetical protein
MSKTIQIRGVPDSVYAELKRRATQRGVSLSEFLTSRLAQIALEPEPPGRLTREEWLERLRRQEPIDITAEDIVNAIRAHRDA